MTEKTHRWSSLAGGVLVSVCGLLVFWQGRHLSGRFGYTLDDSYIHLRVSEMIRHGHYGLEPGVAASPSSSILWPFLLAPFASFGWHAVVPLVLNLVCIGAVVPVIAATLRRCWPDPAWHRWAPVAGVVLVLSAGLLSTATTGMENTAQTLAVAVMVLGAATAVRGEPLRWWFWVAVVVGPTIRYETLLVSVVAIAIAFLAGERRRALGAVGAIVAVLGAFSGFLLSLGLDPVPSSVLAKSVGGLANVTRHGNLVPLLMLTLVLAAVRLWMVRDLADLRLASAGVAVFGGHLLFATTEPLRYATSIVVLALVTIAVALPALLPTHPASRAAASILLTLLVLVPSWGNTVQGVRDAPDGMAQIAEQQCQLHELVVGHLRESVAANDIGCLAYRNPYPVLDLWGLASQRARELRFDNAPDWVDTVMTEGDVHVAMVYDLWFVGDIPASWILVAELHSTTPGYAADTVVHLYATDAAAARRLRSAVDDYDRTDHPGTVITRA